MKSSNHSLDDLLFTAREDATSAAAAIERLNAGERPTAGRATSTWRALMSVVTDRSSTPLTGSSRDALNVMLALGSPPEEVRSDALSHLERDMRVGDLRSLDSLDALAALGVKPPSERFETAMNLMLHRAVRDLDTDALSIYEKASVHGLSASATGQANTWQTALTNLCRDDPVAGRQVALLQRLRAQPDVGSQTSSWAVRATLQDLGLGNLDAKATLDQLLGFGIPLPLEPATRAADHAVRAVVAQSDGAIDVVKALYATGATASPDVVGYAIRSMAREAIGGSVGAESGLAALSSLGLKADSATVASIREFARRTALHGDATEQASASRVSQVLSNMTAPDASPNSSPPARALACAMSLLQTMLEKTQPVRARPDDVQRYVLGFAFDDALSHVVLLQKAKPAWAAGMWNGLGGKIEPGEAPADAMAREFQEECGVLIQPSSWKHLGTFERPDWHVECYCSKTDDVFAAKTVEKEPVTVFPVHEFLVKTVLEEDLYSGLECAWLVPYARRFLLKPEMHNTFRSAPSVPSATMEHRMDAPTRKSFKP